MHASGALGTTVGRVERDIDPNPYPGSREWVSSRVKALGGAQEADIVECMDGMRFYEVTYLVAGSSGMGQDSVSHMYSQWSYGTEPVIRTTYPNVTSRKTHEYWSV